MTRVEHLTWCKERAFGYCDRGDANEAVTSMLCDLEEHPETKYHSAIKLGAMMLMSGFLDTPEKARKFIEGFN